PPAHPLVRHRRADEDRDGRAGGDGAGVPAHARRPAQHRRALRRAGADRAPDADGVHPQGGLARRLAQLLDGPAPGAHGGVIIVGLAVYGTLGFASDGAIRWVERRALSWRRTLAG